MIVNSGAVQRAYDPTQLGYIRLQTAVNLLDYLSGLYEDENTGGDELGAVQNPEPYRRSGKGASAVCRTDCAGSVVSRAEDPARNRLPQTPATVQRRQAEEAGRRQPDRAVTAPAGWRRRRRAAPAGRSLLDTIETISLRKKFLLRLI